MNLTLRAKLSIFAGLLNFLVVSGVGLSVYYGERQYLITKAQQNQVEMVQVLAQMSREALTTQNELLLSSYLALIRRSRALAYALVLNDQGFVSAHSDFSLVGQKPTDSMTQKALAAQSLLRQKDRQGEDTIIDLALPIFVEKNRVGTARVAYSQNAVLKQGDKALSAAIYRIALAAAAAFALGLFGAVWLASYISEPIQKLRDGARDIGNGNLSLRIDIPSKDEMGELAREFNVMAQKLQELDQLKQDFVSNVTHELRSPLTSLRGYVNYLLAGDAGALKPDQEEQLIVIKNNAARLSKFIDALLDVAKIEARRVELHPEPVSLAKAAREMEVLFRPQLEEKSLTFKSAVPKKLPPVVADADTLDEILTNLISNAIKFTPEGGRVALAAAPADDGWVQVTVEDSGIGIPPESIDAVFNKFEQVKPTEGLVRKTKGTGLGLTIVKGYVEAHGGRVWIDSRVGEGTSVHFTLPEAVARH
jgi:signal transduction histidine kinase